MKKTILFFAVLGSLAGKNQAQTNIYHPFASSNASWNVKFGGFEAQVCYDRKYFIAGDTLVNSITYHKINYFGWTGYYKSSDHDCFFDKYTGTPVYCGAFREDLMQKKVYFLPPAETKEGLIYDFNLAVGDTVPEGINNPHKFITVSSIDSISVGGNYRKRFNLTYTVGVSIIEGIGSTSGLTEDINFFEIGGRLYCYSENNQNVFPSSSGQPCLLQTSETELTKVIPFTIYPNPASDRIYVECLDQQNFKVQFFNVIGACVLQSELGSRKEEIDISTLTTGIYLIIVTGVDGTVQKKVIKE